MPAALGVCAPVVLSLTQALTHHSTYTPWWKQHCTYSHAMYSDIYMRTRHNTFWNTAIILGLLVQFLLSSFKKIFFFFVFHILACCLETCLHPWLKGTGPGNSRDSRWSAWYFSIILPAFNWLGSELWPSPGQKNPQGFRVLGGVLGEFCDRISSFQNDTYREDLCIGDTTKPE